MKEYFLLLFVITSFFEGAQNQDVYVPKALQRKYSFTKSAVKPSGTPYKAGVKTFTKSKSYLSPGSSIYGFRYPGPTSGGEAQTGMKYRGGCNSMPQAPAHARLRCSEYSGCQATCLPKFQFPNGETQLFITCNEGEWQVVGTEWETIPACEPICLPRCENKGICVAPNQCKCPENYSGPQCQFEKKPCMNYPPMPLNSRRSCRSSTCTVTCLKGHQFPDGSSITTMTCKDGNWIPSREGWASVPDCQATCNPPCQNGGNCLSFNVCQCPQEYRGPQCQYSVDACSARKLKFNGRYNCSGNMESFSCSLACPEGVKFDSAPAPVYTCSYATGEFLPSPIPQCILGNYMEIVPIDNLVHPSGELDGKPSVDAIPFYGYGLPPYVIVEDKKPQSGSCFTWGGSHFKTFDGKVYSFNSECAHTLVRDDIDSTFSIVIQNNQECRKHPEDCYRIVKIYVQDNEYILKRTDEGIPILESKKKTLPIPGQLPGIRAEMLAHYVVLSLDSIGTKVRWDGQSLVQVEVSEGLWNRTSGLCGKLDGDPNNDMITKSGVKPKTIVAIAESWQVDSLNEECNSVPTEEHACQAVKIKGGKSNKAVDFCNKLLSDKRFAPCHSVMDTSVLLDACTWDYCNCFSSDPTACACNTLNVYVRECAHKGVTTLAKWRDEDTCPMKCTGGRVYMSCGPKGGQAVCGAAVEKSEDEACEEGCYCPPGTVLHDSQCITKDKCPCRLRGKSFPNGASVPKDCNTCTCVEGQWVCTQVSCGSRCAAVGDPHYVTFDGKRFDFMGQCSYYLVKASNFSIEAENVACAGSISQAMNFPISVSSGLPSCTKTVTIKMNGQIIKLKQNQDISVNGQELVKIPYTAAGITIRSASSIFVVAELPNGIEVWWDGMTRAYIDMPANFQERTGGLCGTFNNNQKDDFLTPEDDIEQSVVPFANKWKTEEKCNDVPDRLKQHPCDLNIHNKAIAEGFCKKIKSELFADCHWHVDPETFYQDCLYDMCACEGKISKCLCPIVAAYAQECARKDVRVDWRNEINECGIHCPGGQKYQVCGNSCTRTCSDVASRPDCKRQCVEGCNCPEGEALDEHGECIPIGQCPCQYEGLEFQAGYKEVRPSSKGPELCTCVNADWSCRPATPTENKMFPKASDSKSKCRATDNFEFTTCEPVEPVTCKNMHNQEFFTAEVCHAGCKCKEGYVLDSVSKKCVLPQDCPCHHGGRSYKDNATVQNDCNLCVCKQGKWKCTDRQCAAECNAWGDSHFKTFDGKMYDYQGQCDYVLAKGQLNGDSIFDITMQNVPCGSLGVSCSKSVTIKVGSGTQQDTITLTRDKKVPEMQILNRMTLRNQGIFVVVEAPDLGLVVHWDKGTRVYVKVDPRWKGKIKGLCGNYNNDESDDFQTPSGGVPEVSAKLFGDSWKLQSYCPDALEITDTCEERPDRKVWALKQCGILKSNVFAPCHSEVPVDNYLDKCVFDTCACDQGGDCECLCTAIASYAQECNNRGVPIKWRSQELCPMQCDEGCSKYSPCVSTCPYETCENFMVQSPLTKLCKEDSCVEGCQPKLCPPDHVYYNSSFLECVPKKDCKVFCMEIDGVVYYEGDIINEDDCHTCHCSRGKESCQGQPCSSTIIPSSTEEDDEAPRIYNFTKPAVTTQQMEQTLRCKPGWSSWINQDASPKTKKKTISYKVSDVEPLPSLLVLQNTKEASCYEDMMVDIECRTVKDHKSPKETGLDVECSLEKGLICKSGKGLKECPDFEIRVKCDCEPIVTTVSPIGPCDPAHPIKEYPYDCHKYLQCSQDEYIEKTCGEHMFYNPQTMTCDWPDNVLKIRSDCGVEEKKTVPPLLATQKPPGPKCPPGEIYDDCAIECENMCMYYLYVVREKGECLGDSKCVAGCVSPIKKLTCPEGMLHINQHMCVDIHDCLCHSSNGTIIKPGRLYKPSDCEYCQCVDNSLACDDSKCRDFEQLPSESEEEDEETGVAGGRTPPSDIIVGTVTPPVECSEDMYIDLVQGDEPLPDEAFSASSVLKDEFKPQYSRINSRATGTSAGSWSPAVSDKDQYLQINLGRQEPVYGIIIKGSPLYNEYVTSYLVAYSPDGHKFGLVQGKDKKPQVFRGSSDAHTPVKQMFDIPVEAKIIRIKPQSWHDAISLRAEVIGCAKFGTTPSFVTPKPIMCEDPMGLEDRMMSDQQVSVSSEKSPKFDKKHLPVDGKSAWQPLTNTPTEWVQFDFLEPRNITGFKTQGGPDGWITAYKIKYSHDTKHWNPMLDKNLEEILFLGNFDEKTPHTNHFDLPILTQYIQLIPWKWNKNIQLRVEPLGCFKPYPETPEVTTEEPSLCNKCPGVTSSPELELGACKCARDMWWDGENCISRINCPCFVGHYPYAVGTVYESEDCSQCVCKLGGVSHCTPKVCEKCGDDLRSVVTSTCGCICEKCGEGEKLCETGNICINASLWCNGIQDCPDDELYCDITTTPLPTTTPTEPPTKCPPASCPPGYKVEEVKKERKKAYDYKATMFSTYRSKGRYSYSPAKASYKAAAKGGVKGGVKAGVKGRKVFEKPELVVQERVEEEACPKFRCIPQKPEYPPGSAPVQVSCPPAICPAGYSPEYDVSELYKKNDCPKYECKPPPPPDAICNVTGRTFNTFDNTEYKYDICNHVLARDLASGEWEISLKKDCKDDICSRDLVIQHDEHLFVLHPDLSVEYDGFRYTVDQTKKIGSQSQFFSISMLGDMLLYVSNRYGFWIIWDRQGNVKIGVSTKLIDTVDGLCGFYSGSSGDDKRKPDGTLAKATVEFGDSWAIEDEECEAKTCPIPIQNKAWVMCNQIKDQTFAPCAKVIDIEAFVSRCLETTCTCLQAANGSASAEDNCRCQTLSNFVVDCLTSDNELELLDWRSQHDCPVYCSAPLIHHDCYRRRCEPTCTTISDPNACPKIPNVCFPGCYCPPGLVRHEDTCIKASTCRDCECNVLPHLQYVTYDENDFTVNGNCVYVMSRDALAKNEEHKFQVLITNHPCADKPGKMCVGKVTILYNGHKIHIILDKLRSKLRIIVDGVKLEDFSEVKDYMKVVETISKHVKFYLTKIQVQVNVYYPSLGVSVKAPSHKYGGKLEGLCGDCNKDPGNDVSMPNGTLASDPNELALSWVFDTPGQDKETCNNLPEPECEELPVDKDPCVQLLDENRYSQCHPLLSPSMFLEWCRKDVCGGNPGSACDAIGSYGRECLNSGFCVNWHSNLCPAETCPSDQIYKQCGSSCAPTCENIKQKDKKCKEIPTDGCFCPEGKVKLNGTCVVENHCEVCDEEGHHPGDVWQKDACTNCSCVGTKMVCDTKQCPAFQTVCQTGYTAVKLPPREGDCCDKYVCTAVTPSPTCEPPQKIECSPGQMVKLDLKADGCQQFICVCVPIEDCDKLDLSTDKPLDDGLVKIVNDKGCCPVVEIVCKEELCPEPPQCPKFYSVKNITIPGKCCMTYNCEKPKDKCIFDASYTADEKGGERLRNKYEQQQVLKNANETWSDGPCRECQCSGSDATGYHSACSVTECPAVETSSDFEDYVLEQIPLINQCCPSVVRVACKDGKNVYQIGEKWHPKGDYCTTLECVVQPNGNVQKQHHVTSCDTSCKIGFEYVPATNDSEECCGSCKAVACVVDGKIRQVNEEWTSSDFCTNYYCDNDNGSMQVQAQIVNCPEVSAELVQGFVIESIPVEGECCLKRNIVACKVGKEVYQVGESWPSPDGDKCKTFTCVKNGDGKLMKRESVETCNKECHPGWEYQESDVHCCGECVQVACLVGDELKTPGENWTSDDGCVTFSCEQIGMQFSIVSAHMSCPNIDDCPEQYVYNDGCCDFCNMTLVSASKCAPEEISEKKSIGLIKGITAAHGLCKNKKPISGFTECIGACHSATIFNAKTQLHESACSCCQVTEYDSIDVEVECEDGYVFKKSVPVPSACSCEGCAAAAKYTKPTTKSNTKTGVKTGVKH